MATFRVASYLVFPLIILVATVSLTVGTVFSPLEAESRQYAQIVGVLLALLMVYWLRRRFQRFLSKPPPVPEAEPLDDGRLIMMFRVITIGVFVAACVIAYLLGARTRA